MFYWVSSKVSFPSPEVLELLDSNYSPEVDPDRLNLALRKQGYDPATCVEVASQVELRQKARHKLGTLADSLLFTRAGLEQASRLAIARYHAMRLRDCGSVSDLSCGLGIDAFAFAEADLEVVAIDIDEVTAEFAASNLSRFENAKARAGDARDHSVQTKAVFLDPARRDLKASSRSRKLLTPDDFEPPIDFVFELLAKHPGGVKLSPAMPHELIDPRFESAWVSNKGDLVEFSQWSTDSSRAGKRFAVMVDEDAAMEYTGDVFEADVAPLGEYIYEPDPALIRSHLIGAFAREHGLGSVSQGIAYLTGAECSSPWLRGFKVVEELPLHEKAIKAYLAKLDIGRVEIKKRGVDIDPEVFRKKLKLKGSGAATLIATKVGGARKALVCHES